MAEGSTLEGVSEMSDFGVTRDQSCEPIVGDHHAWNKLALATELKACFAENRDLIDDIPWGSIWIW